MGLMVWLRGFRACLQAVLKLVVSRAIGYALSKKGILDQVSFFLSEYHNSTFSVTPREEGARLSYYGATWTYTARCPSSRICKLPTH